MKQYTIGFISAIMLFLVVIVSAGFAPAPNFGMTGKYQIDTLLIKQEDYLGNKSYEVLYTVFDTSTGCLLYTSPSPRDRTRSRMPSSA